MDGQYWWDSTHATSLGTMPLDQIPWDKFMDMFYVQYFSAIVRSQKKEFMSLEQLEGMFVVKYHARFITVERFAPGNFASKRELTAQFVSGLHIRIRSMLANLHVQNWSRQYEGVGVSVCP